MNKPIKEIPVALEVEEWQELLEILEESDDEEWAALTLAELSKTHKRYGELLLNKDQLGTDYYAWKNETDLLFTRLQNLKKQILTKRS